jgi:hypothetical protein
MTHKFLTRPGERWSPSGRYGLALQPATELPLRPCQRQALEESQASAGLFLVPGAALQPFAPAAAESWSPKAPLIDATAGGRFQGWRVP